MQGLQRLVQRVGGGQLGQLGQRACPARPRASSAASRARRASSRSASLRTAACRRVGQVGEGRAAPQGQRVVEQPGRLRRVAVGQRPGALVGEPLEAVEVDVVAGGRQPVAAVDGADRVVPEGPPQPPDQRLQRRRSRRRAGRRPTPRRSARRGAPGRARSASAVSSARSRAPRAGAGVPSSREGLRGAEDAVADRTRSSCQVARMPTGGARVRSGTGCRTAARARVRAAPSPGPREAGRSAGARYGLDT